MLSARIERSIAREPGGCWLWLLSRNASGYGKLQILRKDHLAHRYVYEAERGPIPDGLTLDHLCRNTACVNPEHLEPVTIQENQRRGNSPQIVNARKTHCIHGHPLAVGNLHRNTLGRRVCAACNRAAVARYKARKKGGQS